MNALTIGALIFLYLLVSNATTAFIVAETTPSFATNDDCTTDQNATVCRGVSETSFVEAILDVSVGEIDGAPDWFNGLWLGVNIFLLTMAIILIVGWFVGVFFGGAS